MSSTPRDLIDRSWQAMNPNDWPSRARSSTMNLVLDWPQSGERIRGCANVVAVNERYPAAGLWRFTIQRVLVTGDGGVTDVGVTDGARRDRVITFFETREDRILRMTE